MLVTENSFLFLHIEQSQSNIIVHFVHLIIWHKFVTGIDRLILHEDNKQMFNGAFRKRFSKNESSEETPTKNYAFIDNLIQQR